MGRTVRPAAQAARAAETAWKRHKAVCPKCTTAARGRKWGELCEPGAAVRLEYVAAQQAAAADRAAMSGQIPGQLEIPI